MKVRELIAALQEFDSDTEVVLSSDGEGNSYRPCDSPHGYYVFNADDQELIDPTDPDGAMYYNDYPWDDEDEEDKEPFVEPETVEDTFRLCQKFAAENEGYPVVVAIWPTY